MIPMDKVKQGLLLGAIVGFFLALFMINYSGRWWWIIMVPRVALRGAAPQYLRPKDMDDDE